MGQVWSKLESLPVKNEWKFALVNHVSHILSFWGPSLAFMLIRRFKLFHTAAQLTEPLALFGVCITFRSAVLSACIILVLFPSIDGYEN